MIERIGKVTDFRSALTENLLQFDASKDTAEHRIREWLWESRDNRKIGTENDTEEFETSNEGLQEIAKQVGDFDSLDNKKIFMYYAISNNMVNNASDIHLPVDTNVQAVNIDNEEANRFVDDLVVSWAEYDDEQLEKHYNDLVKVLTKFGLDGNLIMEDIRNAAPDSIKNINIGPIQKQLERRGVTEQPNWDEIYLEIRTIKADYREAMTSKDIFMYEKTELAKRISFIEYQKSIEVLKRSIVYNIETSGGEVDVSVF